MPLNIAIIGGGIGGPATAIGLARQGHTVTLYERSENILEGVGFAFRITPNSDRCLKWLGIDSVAGGAVTANTGRMMNVDGKVLAEFKENVDAEKAKKASSVFAYRPSLQQQLLDEVVRSEVRIRKGMKVVDVDVENTTLRFEDGTKVAADLIVAADGVHSSIRPHIIDSTKHHPKASTGHGCLRFTIPTSTIVADPIATPMINDNFRMFTWKGEGKRIVVYPVDFDKQYNFNCTHPEEMSRRETSGDENGNAEAIAYNQPISLDTVRSIYAEFEPVAIRLLELADPNGFRVWKLIDIDEIPTWSLNHSVLLGDAAHVVLPFGFAGASMAIEDAVTLAQCFDSHVKADEIEDRLKLYEKIRKPRVAKVREVSRDFGKGKDGDPRVIQEYREFLASHDAVEYAKQELISHLKAQGKVC